MDASCFASSGSFLVSPFSKRVFSSSRIWPGWRDAALARASGPTTSAAIRTSCPSSSPSRLATGARDSLARDFFQLSSVREAGSLPFSACFFAHLSKSGTGLPRWEQAMTAAPFSSR